jgi:hypothetical protein
MPASITSNNTQNKWPLNLRLALALGSLFVIILIVCGSTLWTVKAQEIDGVVRTQVQVVGSKHIASPVVQKNPSHAGARRPQQAAPKPQVPFSKSNMNEVMMLDEDELIEV